MTYRILSPALVELAEAAEYYESKAPGLGGDFIGEAERVISRIMEFPEAWSRIAEDHRHCNFRRFAYTIVYSIGPADEILIVSIFHQHREPLSWKRNLQTEPIAKSNGDSAVAPSPSVRSSLSKMNHKHDDESIH